MDIQTRDRLALLFEKYGEFLTQNQKQVLHLYLVEDLSITEIGQVLALSRQAIYDTLKKSKEKLEEIEKKING